MENPRAVDLVTRSCLFVVLRVVGCEDRGQSHFLCLVKKNRPVLITRSKTSCQQPARRMDHGSTRSDMLLLSETFHYSSRRLVTNGSELSEPNTISY